MLEQQVLRFEYPLTALSGTPTGGLTINPNPVGINSIGILFPYNRNVQAVRFEMSAKLILAAGSTANNNIDRFRGMFNLLNFDGTPIPMPVGNLIDNDSTFLNPATGTNTAKISLSSYNNSVDLNCFKIGGISVDQVQFTMGNNTTLSGSFIRFYLMVWVEV